METNQTPAEPLPGWVISYDKTGQSIRSHAGSEAEAVAEAAGVLQLDPDGASRFSSSVDALTGRTASRYCLPDAEGAGKSRRLTIRPASTADEPC